MNGKYEPVEIDNRWIVHYRPALILKTLKRHFNAEVCMSIISVKYILKYINKGDQAMFKIENNNKH